MFSIHPSDHNDIYFIFTFVLLLYILSVHLLTLRLREVGKSTKVNISYFFNVNAEPSNNESGGVR